MRFSSEGGIRLQLLAPLPGICLQLTRILHISDLHAFGGSRAGHTDRSVVLNALVEDVRTLHNTGRIDLVVMSGDLAFSGTAEQFQIAGSQLLEALEGALELDRSRIVVVPGNHDVDRGAIDHDSEAGYRSLIESREAANELLADETRLGRATKRLAAWDKFHDEFYAGVSIDRIPPLGFLHRVETEDSVVLVAALNSAWRSSDDDDQGRLILGEQQVRAAVAALESADLPIFVFHHPPDWLARWDADEVRRLTARAKGLVLTGHDHLPDPTLETSVRGTVLHSRGACIYETFDYRNGYSLLDIDRAQSRTRVFLRDWYRDRDVFDAAVSLAPKGVLDLDWPVRGTDLVVPSDVPYSHVMSSLCEIVQQRSIISDYLAESSSDAKIDEILVPPRLWPLPYREAVAMAARGGAKPERVENRELLTTTKVVIVAGETESGVTGTLLWLLADRFETTETKLPVYLPFDPRFKDTRFERGIRRELTRYGVVLEQADPIPELILATDDIAPAHSGALTAFVRFVTEHPEHSFLLGCHGETYEQLERALSAAGVEVEVVHVGPFGRRELRAFVEKLAGGPSDELVERVTKIVRSERLPRNPFIITALVIVILKNIDLSDVNESSLLNAYVSFLLGQGESYDRHGLEMDHRRREHLLSMFARHLIDEDRVSVPRLALEEFVAQYFRERGWGDRLSPGRIADDLISRRVLHESVEGTVGFRHPAFRALFAGMAMLEDKSFSQQLVADPLGNENAIRHAAGLKRSDPDLLRDVAAATRSVMSDATYGFETAMFDLIKSRPGWSREHPDVEALVARLEAPLPEPPQEEEIDEQVDSYHDNLDFYEASGITERHPVDVAWGVATSLARVLRNSELVDDLELKADVLKAVLDDWSVFVVMAAVREDQEGALRSHVEELLGEGAMEDVDPDAVARFFELIITFITVIAAQTTLGTIHLEGTLRRVLDDEEFMESTAHALLATMLYAATGNSDWPDRMATLYNRHAEHPIVAEMVRSYALARYRFGELGEGEATKVESFLANVYTGDPPATSGQVRSIARGQQRDRAVAQLRKRRMLDRRRGAVGDDPFADDLLDAENTDADADGDEEQGHVN
jgi:predicted MPP superfamily phosphohydrolase